MLERGAALDVIRPDEDDQEPGDKGEKEDNAEHLGGSEDDEGCEETDTPMQPSKCLMDRLPCGSLTMLLLGPNPRNSMMSAHSEMAIQVQMGMRHNPASLQIASHSLLFLPMQQSTYHRQRIFLSVTPHIASGTTSPSDSPTSIETPTTKQYALTYDKYPPMSMQQFECHLQIPMSQVALSEVVDGLEGAEEGWPQVFEWVVEKNRERKHCSHSHDNSHERNTLWLIAFQLPCAKKTFQAAITSGRWRNRWVTREGNYSKNVSF